MKYRKLRIAWSVGWGVVAVLLIVLLWVRSYLLATHLVHKRYNKITGPCFMILA